MRHKFLLVAVLVLLLSVLTACQTTSPANDADAPASVTHLRFTLDWAVQGPQAPFLVALDKGYFAEEGLSVVIDRGFGSADAVSKIAGGAYNLGYADINSMIEFNASNPDDALIAIAMILDYPPFSILTLRDRDINTVQDLQGQELGAPAGDAARRLFPMFARSVGIDADSVSWTSMDPPLREPLLIQGDVDAIAGFYFTSFLNLTAAGVAENDIVAFLYADHGLDLYGNAVIAPPSLLEENPEAIRGFLRALTRAWHDTLADPDEAIAIIQRRDSLIDIDVEKQRLMMAIEGNMLTPDVQERGFGDVRPDRLERAIDIVVEAFDLPRTPAASEIFNGDFLPPLEDRLP
ncbi:MAG: ABC transporter substrate-binding protein [Chloroflexota bacterium]|jgi:NitT/TauT family transport system substrate-binding protein